MTRLSMEVVKVNGNTNKEVLKALSALMEFDLDFIGANGKEYLWEEAQGFESNRDYLLDVVSEYDCLSDMIKKYIETAMMRDNYYEDFNYHDIVNISLHFFLKDV